MEQGEVMSEIVVPKKTLDARVAAITGMSTAEVSNLTALFLHEVLLALVAEGCVHLDKLGRLHVVARKGLRADIQHRTGVHIRVPKKYYVVFKKAARLTQAIKEKHHAKVRRRRIS